MAYPARNASTPSFANKNTSTNTTLPGQTLDNLLQEMGDAILLETGNKILLEAPVTWSYQTKH